jgi:hypothetical protein
MDFDGRQRLGRECGRGGGLAATATGHSQQQAER